MSVSMGWELRIYPEYCPTFAEKRYSKFEIMTREKKPEKRRMRWGKRLPTILLTSWPQARSWGTTVLYLYWELSIELWMIKCFMHWKNQQWSSAVHMLQTTSQMEVRSWAVNSSLGEFMCIWAVWHSANWHLQLWPKFSASTIHFSESL